jgi:hypothetical protein
MRHLRLALLLPPALLLSGCCPWWSDDEEPPYHDLRVENRTDQGIQIRYTAVVGVMEYTDDDGDTTYRYSHDEKTRWVWAGKDKDIRVPRDATVRITATYDGIVREFTEEADAWCSCDLSITLDLADFVPAMPAANG